ncbi:class I adenylate-forming enzyme family protein [Actinoallomurus sp. CA-150999]|uniref:class I adenylate-forming enzyme family protein n=1 Tax=Actinoallomurus sp. CA-150999 TaxID=3239887 RepID=UPI003D8C87E3
MSTVRPVTPPTKEASCAGLLVADLVAAGASRALTERVALTGDGWTMSYGRLADDARRWHRLLHESGLRSGERIAILALNGPEYLGVLYGASMCGAVVVLLNTRLDAASIRYQLEDSAARLVIVDPAHHRLAADAGAFDLPAVTLDADYRDRFRAIEPAPAGTVRPDPDGPFVQLYTSGTTGRSKGCVISQRAWVASATNLVTALRLTDADVHIGAGPFFHVAGLGTAMSVLSAGGRLVFGSSRSLDESWELVARHGVTIGTFVGGAVVNAARHPMSATHAGTLRVLTGQAGKHTPAEHREMAELVPHAGYVGIYGSTEAGNFATCTTRADEIARPGTVGRPLIGFRAAVVDPDDRPLEPGEAGELVLRGGSVMSEYWGLPEATAETLRGGWLHTGDVMRMDEDGYLYMLDRLKDMVKTGGENVYSIEVEQVLRRHPAVRDCAVIGVPDARWGEGVKAVVVPASNAEADVESLDAWCLERLAAYKRPRWYQFEDALPTNGAKVDKKRLRADHDPRTCVRLPERR